jgi:uncharacterized lipoprotein YajG
MKLLLFCLSFLLSFLVTAQEVKIGNVENKIVIGDLAGNRNLAFGVKNILEELIQDAGYDLNPDAQLEIAVDLLFFDIKKTNVQIAVYGKNTEEYMLAAQATLYKDGKKKKSVSAKGTAKSISTSTLIIDEGGKFSQSNVSTALKKLCEDLIVKLKL